jgi:cyanate permease
MGHLPGSGDPALTINDPSRIATCPKASAELRRLDHRDLIRSQTVWMLTRFFGALSAIAYIGFGWMAHFMSAHGVPAATVGAMVALLTGVSIPGAMLIPTITPARHPLIVESGSASPGA